MSGDEFGSPKRKFVLQLVLSLGFLILIGRLYQLQYIYGEQYGRQSEENSIRTVVKTPVRGYVYDRHGELVVDNRPSYTVMLTPIDFNMKNVPLLAKILDMTEDQVVDKINRGKKYSQFAPTRVKRDIDFRTLSMLEEHKEKLAGVEVQMESKRFYPTPAHMSHLMGYAKEISDWQLEKLGEYYQPGDIVGSSGIEARYEQSLRGEKGFDYISQNARGQIIGTFNNGKNDVPPKDGLDMHLALDVKVQALAESLLAGRRGAVVAIDPQNGGIIALASKPDYDLSNFSGVTSPEVWKNLTTDEAKPLYNRATLTRYPPGSTFKMLLAIAALENGIIDENYRIVCHGSFPFGNHVFKDLHVHGSTDVIESIQRSCNVFYYQLMLKVGLDEWNKYGREFGFGRQTKVDIMEESSGLLPSTEYFDRVYGKGRWTKGYLVSLGIGQGEVGVTPLQMANYAAMLGNKGHYHQPHAVDYVYNKWTKKMDTVAYDKHDVNISEHTWSLVREGMRRCVMEPGGTGGGARIAGVQVAGKTGTAQNPHGRDHAWFIGFAPYDNPKIAICVLVENGGYGGAAAAPIAGMCMEQFLYGKLIRNETKGALAVQAAKDQMIE
ncbi:MAG: penicillin-binding protein 2 [Acidobacteriota bacterium]